MFKTATVTQNKNLSLLPVCIVGKPLKPTGSLTLLGLNILDEHTAIKGLYCTHRVWFCYFNSRFIYLSCLGFSWRQVYFAACICVRRAQSCYGLRIDFTSSFRLWGKMRCVNYCMSLGCYLEHTVSSCGWIKYLLICAKQHGWTFACTWDSFCIWFYRPNVMDTMLSPILNYFYATKVCVSAVCICLLIE